MHARAVGENVQPLETPWGGNSFENRRIEARARGYEGDSWVCRTYRLLTRSSIVVGVVVVALVVVVVVFIVRRRTHVPPSPPMSWFADLHYTTATATYPCAVYVCTFVCV